MKVRVEEEITSVSMFLEILFMACVCGILFYAFGGPVFGGGAFIFVLVGSLIGSGEDKRRIGKQINNYISHEDLLHAMRHGQRIVTKTSTLKNYSSDQPILGRLLFGNDLTKKTTYYLEDD
ncbi:MAG: hypothetical protein IIA06_10725 [Proteobacteria bacterium]|nr:hypothetical protein [Pseudomonadota bacterium]